MNWSRGFIKVQLHYTLCLGNAKTVRCHADEGSIYRLHTGFLLRRNDTPMNTCDSKSLMPGFLTLVYDCSLLHEVQILPKGFPCQRCCHHRDAHDDDSGKPATGNIIRLVT
jgi:hypothetical protein